METRLVLAAASIIITGGCLAFFAVRFSNPFLKGLGWLAGSFACGTISTTLLTLTGKAPEFLTGFVANGLTILAYVFVQSAILELSERRSKFSRVSLILLGLWMPTTLFFTYVQNSHQMRIVFGDLLVAAQAGQSAFYLFRRMERGLRAPAWYTGAVLAAFAAFNVFRSTAVGLHGIAQDILAPSELQFFSVIIYLGTALGVALGFFWMTTAKLRFTLEHLASTDSLTGAANRRNFQLLCEKELSRSQRSGEPFSLLMADIDHFKEINDRHGHEAGDTVLCAIAGLLQEQIRPSDTLGRWGGEEFVMLLPACELEGAAAIAERLRERVSHWSAPSRAGNLDVQVTISLGVAMFRGRGDTLDDLFRRGDEALYQAKAAGRNCIRSVD
ncbi:diguanylate cyclase (GGDEF) domain-containing protein [Granulicella rosea]|uniref:diguanylate cyclase n=1 Tax=Granulicella rosea TaxID=474952 RepID=A0A239JNU5_9BACT|nr:GGDEF domain-containing protein [Granulicella rosea]SNT07490.1 diguanylate cyclase (GGDEF) domain-containing protein [Granulicella rosea]